MKPEPSYEELKRKVAELMQAEARLRESEERARRAAEVNRTMAELGRIINSTLSVEEVYEQFATAVKRIIPFDRAMIALINEGQETWTKAYSSGIEIEGWHVGDVHPLIGLVRHVFEKRSGDILHLKDEMEVARDYPLLLPSFRAGLRSMMAAPLISKDQVIGVIHFSSFRPGAYTEADVTLAEDVAGQIAGAVANVLVHTRVKRAEEALRESEEQTKRVAEKNMALAEIGRIIGASLSIDEVYEPFAQVLKRIIPFERLTVGIIHSEQGTYSFPHTSGMEIAERLKGDTIPLPRVALDIVRKRSGVIFNAQAEKGFPEEYPTLMISYKAGIRSIIVTPLISNNEVIGTLFLGSTDSNAYKEHDLTLAGNVAAQISGAIANAQLFEDHKRAEEALRRSESEKTLILNSTSEMISFYDPDLRLVWANRVSAESAGRKIEDLLGRHCYEIWRNRTEPCIGCPVIRARETRCPQEGEVRTPDGRYLLLHGYPVLNEDGEMVGLIEVDHDFTKRKEAEEEKERLQAQLTQAQKMESVGRLAGGVAHDFNNMLGIIIGNAEMAALQVGPDKPPYQNLQEILKASHRSADTVRQLLAFARKQTISPKVLDLNDTVSGMLKMLRRLIGEDIDLLWVPGKNLGNIKMDPSQVSQILANLAVNSRDAIQGVGKITIESANVVFDESYCREHEGCLPGEYVLLAVSDTGVGMSREVMERLFDPFFTTKEIGKGTGLGLATIYGIVKQNNGFIDVYSEPGEGSSFKIYFPRREGESVPVREKVGRKIPRGTETILIAEDEAPLLYIARDILTAQGYIVLAARTPKEALALSGTHAGPIHLLLTDVVMPEMNGRQLAELLRQTHPSLKCLFMSGYTADVVAHHGVLDEGVHFIEKPFSPKFLAEKVRVVLDSPDS